MNDKEAIEMMNRCMGEITQLRNLNETLRPKAEAYDNIAIVLNLLPKTSQGYGEDLVWRLKKKIEELQANEIKPQP